MLLLHKGNFGIERMKQLARIVVYRPNIDSDISKMGQQCGTCGQHQSVPTQAPVHPWMMQEKRGAEFTWIMLSIFFANIGGL